MTLSPFNRSAFRFAQDGTPMLVLDDVTIELPGGSPFALAPVLAPEAPAFLPPVAPLPAADPVPASTAIAEPAPAMEAAPPEPPVPVAEAPEPPPPQSQAELDLYGQFVHLADGFNGDQALADLLASHWAQQNGWQGAGGGPIA